jgi:hypothetical protein
MHVCLTQKAAAYVKARKKVTLRSHSAEASWIIEAAAKRQQKPSAQQENDASIRPDNTSLRASS